MTIQNISFRTRARTIDHLGREQIADCPTAVSELWKNAYDAYARKVELNIFDGEIPVAVISDDGHGMSHEELVNKWLVVGTESKISASSLVSENDRDGLPLRQRQGQKGIGRLSSANLGSLLLLVSKRKNNDFTAALIDWRIFENPYLMLHDIQIPTIEFSEHSELPFQINEMFEMLMGNIWGSGGSKDKERDERINKAWLDLEKLEAEENRSSTKKSIEETIISSNFDTRHFSCWDVWSNRAEQGTAMFIANISDDLFSQLSEDSRDIQDENTLRSQKRLFQTLSNFIDPFVRLNENPIYKYFSTSVTVWNGLIRRPIIDEDRAFRIENLDDLEHIVDGKIDKDGVFIGSIKLFGKWLPDQVVIKNSSKRKYRSDGACGPVHIRLGGFEKDFKKTSLSREKFEFFNARADLYAGFMVHRDGLRVMPYGREDNDYFEIEKRRSIHAGRYFWSNRNIFGRVAITRLDNPNLKDKAGREGLIDNTASKRFRSLIENILIETAKKYFGSDSDSRKTIIPDIKALRAQEKAEEDKKKLSSQQKKIFRSKLKNNYNDLLDFLKMIENLHNEVRTHEELDVFVLTKLKERASAFSDGIKDFSLSPVPSSLGTLESDYKIYRKIEKEGIFLLSEINSSINFQLEKVKPRSAGEIARTHMQRAAAQLHSRIRKWAVEGRNLMADELHRFDEIVESQNKAYHNATSLVIENVESGLIDIGTALNTLDEEYQSQYQASSEIITPYISALKSLRQQIDLENLATHAVSDSNKMREELDRLHALAQLGITVEIVGHELEALDLTMSRGLRELPNEIKSTNAYKSIMHAQQSLSDRWRFLSPLKLSGDKYYSTLTGTEIFEYVNSFFEKSLLRNNIKFSKTKDFENFSIYEQAARIYPVFINLINNSRYWVMQKESNTRTIILDCREDEVIIADDGPGVSEDDWNSLFSLFFSRKTHGGRGVGLYLCRTNLIASGHIISYETDEKKKILPGANFKINFKDAKY